YGLLYKVVSEVGKLQDSRVLESLFKLLKSDKVENDDIHLQRIKAGLRAKSAQVLGELGDANATLPLIDVLQNDSDEKVRQSAVEALSKLKDAQAVDPLIDALVNDDDIEVRISVASALCELRDVRALEPLIETLQSSDNYRLRLEVITALAIFEDKRVVDLLNAILESDSNLTLRSRAAMVLGDLKDKPSEVNLRHALYNDTSAEVRHYALLALYKLEVSLHKELKSFDDKKVIDLLSAVLSSRFALEEKVQSVEVLRLMEHPMAQEAVRRWDDGDYSFLG
ncbi:MAG: HEAT repeat domain-containing protein, partial [Chloroflexota bacterium]